MRRTKNPGRTAGAKQDSWSSPGMFLLASVGFMVGLNNFWQFPNHLALYGGSAFLFVYLVFLLVLGVPMLMTQIMLGRLGHATPEKTLAMLAGRARAWRGWRWLGVASVVSGFLVLSYYNVVAGWILAYVARAVTGRLDGLTTDGAASVFTVFVRDPEKQLFWHSLFVLMTLLPLTVDLRAGLERAVRYGTPVMFVLLLVLVGYAAASDSFALGAEYFLRMDFSRLGEDGLLTALGDAFFSLGLGVGTYMMYGAYLRDEGPLLRPALTMVFADLVAGVCAALIVFPVLFAGGGVSAEGPGLLFQSLTVAFDALPFGSLMRAVLFVFLGLVAWLSTIGLAEPCVAWLMERRRLTRPRAVLWVGMAGWLLGVVVILSLNRWAFAFSFLGIPRTLGLFDVLILASSFLFLPLVGLLLAVFAGWVLRPETTREALAIQSPCAHDAWLWLNRLFIPLMLIFLLLGIRLFL